MSADPDPRPLLIAAGREGVSVGFEAHLMIEDPDPCLEHAVTDLRSRAGSARA